MSSEISVQNSSDQKSICGNAGLDQAQFFQEREILAVTSALRRKRPVLGRVILAKVGYLANTVVDCAVDAEGDFEMAGIKGAVIGGWLASPSVFPAQTTGSGRVRGRLARLQKVSGSGDDRRSGCSAQEGSKSGIQEIRAWQRHSPFQQFRRGKVSKDKTAQKRRSQGILARRPFTASRL